MYEDGMLFPPDEPSKRGSAPKDAKRPAKPAKSKKASAPKTAVTPEQSNVKPPSTDVPPATPPESLGILTVLQLTQMVRGAISARLPSELHVAGQISNLSAPSGGHLYFTLKDAASEVRCVMWRSAAAHLKFRPGDGLEVVATGGVDVFEPRGQYQLYVRRLEPRGVGALELAFRQLKERLGREGLFDPDRKRRLPRFPRAIAVVTSPSGAALRDIVQTLARRWPIATVIVVGVRVQGDGAATEIADAIRRVNVESKKLGGIDALIVGRGGGSIEDLWAFNEEVVARAIHASDVPVISAVGHEVDFTIADFVADLRAATPTAAAELVAPMRDEVLAAFESWGIRLGRSVRSGLDLARSRLASQERSPVFREPLTLVQRRGERVDDLAARLGMAIRTRLGRIAAALHEAEVRLTRVRPEAVLAARREKLARIEHRLRWAQGHFNLMKERRLGEWAARLSTASPMRRVTSGGILLGQLEGRLGRGVQSRVDRATRHIDSTAARLAAASHESVLARGFSILRHAGTGQIVTTPKAVAPGDAVVTQTAGGNIDSVVTANRNNADSKISE